MKKTKRRGTPARHKRKAKRSTALVAQEMPQTIAELVRGMPAAALSPLSSDPIMSATFVGTFRLGTDQIAALRRPVADDEVSWRAAKRDGPEIIPYLSHNGYRDRLDGAFGLGGWGMLPIGMPKRDGDFVFVPYALVVDGTPRIYTWGEQQIFQMTYGDALEGCKSNAIARCGKELGIARELWDRKHVATLLSRKGTIAADGSTRGAEPRAGYNVKEAEPITQPQRQRLWTIVRKSGRPEFEVERFLREMFNVDSSKKILRGDYDAICKAIESPGDLPRPPAPAREPGEEG